MRRPHEMRLIKLSRYEYQIIGEIAVLSGMIEQEMKELIVKLVKAPWPDGIALVAHLNFSSLCDIALALLPSTVPDTKEKGFSLARSFETAIKNVRNAYEDRNKVLHGPFSPWTAIVGAPKSTLKINARSKISYQAFTFNRETLTETLSELIKCHSVLFGCVGLLEIERGESEYPSPLPRTRKADQQASPQRSRRPQQLPPLEEQNQRRPVDDILPLDPTMSK